MEDAETTDGASSGDREDATTTDGGNHIDGGTVKTNKNQRKDRTLITHKYRGSPVDFSISKSVEPNEELKVG